MDQNITLSTLRRWTNTNAVKLYRKKRATIQQWLFEKSRVMDYGQHSHE